MKKILVVLISVVISLEINTKMYAEEFLNEYPMKLDKANQLALTKTDIFKQPCVFKIGNGFYDFTPFSLVSNLWPT